MSAPHFNITARLLHWLMAAMILSMLFIGVAMVASVSERPWLIDLHRPLGMAILLLALLRLANRLRHSPPPLPRDLPRWQVLAATASHRVLYSLMFALPLLGWSMLSAGGYPITMFGDLQLPAIMPHDPTLYGWLRRSHGLLAWLLFLILLGHIAAALFHAWIRRDGVFTTMVRRTAGPAASFEQPPGIARSDV